MQDLPIPPWEPTKDETKVSGDKTFEDCEEVLSAVFAGSKNQVIQRGYYLSKEWGKVLRAKILESGGRVPVTMLATCWFGLGADVEIALRAQLLNESDGPVRGHAPGR